MSKADKQPEKLLQTADALLAEVAGVQRRLQRVKDDAAAAVNQVAAFYEPRIVELKQQAEASEKLLIIFCKKHKAPLFTEARRNRVDVDHGALLYEVVEKVKRARGVLEALKREGLKNAIQTVEKVKWDVLEKWSDTQLASVGTKRKKTENFKYEIAKAQKAQDE